MNLTKFTRNLLLALMVAVVAVGAGTLPGTSVFVQCTDGPLDISGRMIEFCGEDTDGVGTTDDDFINGTDTRDEINTTGDDVSTGIEDENGTAKTTDLGDFGDLKDGSDFNADDNTGNDGPSAAGGDDTVIANGGDDTVATDGQDTVMLGDGNDEASTGPETDNVFPGGHTRNDVPKETRPEDVRSFTQDGFVSGEGDVSVYTGAGNDKVWVNQGEVTGVLVIDCGAGNNDSVNFVGFGEIITTEEQTQSRVVDPKTKGEIYTINCENLNGLPTGS